MVKSAILLFVLVCIFCVDYCNCFYAHRINLNRPKTHLHLKEITGTLVDFKDMKISSPNTDTTTVSTISNLDSKKSAFYQNLKFHLLEEKDLMKAADLSLNGFYKPRFVLNTAYMSPLEAIILSGITSILQSADKYESWLSSYWGFRTRAGLRLKFPHLSGSSDSIIIVATLPKAFGLSINERHVHEKPTKLSNKDEEELVGIVELCLEEPTGLLYPPLRNPFKALDKSRFQPYLCNLCVAKPYRRFGLGKILCKVCENFATQVYRKKEIYLHVEKNNMAAQNLYFSLGYQILDILPLSEKKRHGLLDINFFKKVL